MTYGLNEKKVSLLLNCLLEHLLYLREEAVVEKSVETAILLLAAALVLVR